MVTLIRGGEVFAPEPLGRKDILLAGGVIEAVADPGRIRVGGLEAEVVDASGKRVLPGLIDPPVGPRGRLRTPDKRVNLGPVTRSRRRPWSL
jgi:beta-aspartyl-dipeptidase (metallo-type)